MTTPSFSTNPYAVPANGTAYFSASGSFLVNLSTAMAAGSLKINVGQGSESRFDAGDTLVMPTGATFDSFTLRNTTGADIIVTVGVAQGEIRIAGQVNIVGTVAVTGAVNANVGATLTSTADVAIAATTTTQVKAANTSRKEIVISNLIANNTVIRVGESSAGAARGVEVGIGGSLVLSNTAAVYVYNPSGSGINIGVLENIT